MSSDASVMRKEVNDGGIKARCLDISLINDERIQRNALMNVSSEEQLNNKKLKEKWSRPTVLALEKKDIPVELKQLQEPEERGQENMSVRLARLESRVSHLEHQILEGKKKLTENNEEIDFLRMTLQEEYDHRKYLENELVMLKSVVEHSETPKHPLSVSTSKQANHYQPNDLPEKPHRVNHFEDLEQMADIVQEMLHLYENRLSPHRASYDKPDAFKVDSLGKSSLPPTELPVKTKTLTEELFVPEEAPLQVRVSQVIHEEIPFASPRAAETTPLSRERFEFKDLPCSSNAPLTKKQPMRPFKKSPVFSPTSKALSPKNNNNNNSNNNNKKSPLKKQSPTKVPLRKVSFARKAGQIVLALKKPGAGPVGTLSSSVPGSGSGGVSGIVGNRRGNSNTKLTRRQLHLFLGGGGRVKRPELPTIFPLGPQQHATMLRQLRYVKEVMQDLPWAKGNLRHMLTRYTEKEMTKDEMYPQLCHLTSQVNDHMSDKHGKMKELMAKKDKMSIQLSIAEQIINETIVTKHGRRGKPHQTRLFYDISNPLVLFWRSKNGTKCPEGILLNTVTAIENAISTPVFNRASKKGLISEGTCISLITPDRSLDLTVKTTIQREWLLKALAEAVTFAKEWHETEAKRSRLRRM